MFALLLSILFPLFASQSDLTVKVNGCRTQKGQLYIALYDNKEVFPVFGKQLRGEVVLLSKGQQFTFTNLKHKVYAIAVFHDLNRNGVLDKNPIGIPTEPYGFSNNARNTFSAPSFGQASFTLSKNRTISITVK
jgi:uncharacterized protein (DUF2141 family)